MVWPPQSLLVQLAKMNFCSKAIKLPMDWSTPEHELVDAKEGAKEGTKDQAGGAKEGAGAKGGAKEGSKDGAKGTGSGGKG